MVPAPPTTGSTTGPDPDVTTLVVGAGFSGIGTGIALDRAGFGDFLLVDDADGYGGTWHWNTYPGVAVDIPSFSYQFSFAQRPTWSRSYAPGEELKDYAEHCATRFGLRERTRFGTRIASAEFDVEAALWRVRTTSADEITTRYLVDGGGPLSTPKYPDIEGLDTFAGEVMHTARWDHDVPLEGRRVAIIGTGASAVQIIPEIAPLTEHLTVFQRTPIWCFPKLDVPLPAPVRLGLRLPGARWALRGASQAFVEATFPLVAQYASYIPFTGRMERSARAYLAAQVTDPNTRAKLTPAYAIGCKRPSFHNGYLATFNRDDVALVTEPIVRIEPTGVVTADGERHDVDVLLLATGFKVADPEDSPSFRLVGATGETMAEYFQRERLQAYQGVSLPGFPNYFTVFGPYGYNGASYFTLIEAQTHHIVRCLRAARDRNATRVEVTPEANARYFETMLARRHTQVFWNESCGDANSYYFDQNGDVPLRRASTPEVWWQSRRFPLGDYAFS